MTPNGYLRSLTRRAAFVLVAAAACQGQPARLVAGAADTVIVNNLRPVRIPMRVLDADGHDLPNSDVRYRWASGAPVPVSRSGMVTCARPGDAEVRAALGPLSTRFIVHCRPVRRMRANIWNDFMLGDSARELPAEFVGVDGRPVTLLVGQVRVEDSTIVALDGLRIRPLAPGRTYVWVSVGDHETGGEVRVFAPGRTLEEVRPDRRLIATPVRLAPGEAVRWPLPVGLFSLVFLPGPTAQAPPTLAVDGAIMCMPALGPGIYGSHCLARAPGATVTVTYPGRARQRPGAPAIVGSLALEWERAH